MLVLPQHYSRRKIIPLRLELLPRQRIFVRNCDAGRYNAYIGGFGSGKTHVLVLQILRYGGGGVASRGLLGAPTYKMLEDTTQKKFFDICPPSWISSYSKSKNSIHLRNGTEILCRSLERPQRLSGLELDWFALDEIGEVKEATFKMLQGRLRRPGGIHKGFGVGNPTGITHWTYNYFVTLAKEHPEVYRLVQATSYENTFLPKHFAEDMDISFGIGTVYHRRYVMGEFAAFEGSYWVNFDARYSEEGGHKIHVHETLSKFKGPVHWGRVIDFGFEHPFVCLWYATDGHTIVFFDEYVQKHGLIQWHCLQIREHEKRHQKLFGAHTISATYTDHDAVSRAEIGAAKDEVGNSIGFDCTPTEKRVMESILLVQTLFGDNRIYISDECTTTLTQVPSYRAKADVIGEEPLMEDEDTCACIRYACWPELFHTATWHRHKTTYLTAGDIHEVSGLDYDN
jgi:PBSX family phage terminase large subunit